MPENIQQFLPFILLGIALLVAIWVITRASRKTTIIDKEEGDVLDEGASPAGRNQALIDSAPAATHDNGVPLETETPADAVSTPPQPAATPEAAPAPVTAAQTGSSSADDLKRIKGLGPKLVTILADQGITSFAQIAAWTDEDVERIDATLGRFAGRITRDQWVEQAKLLAADDDEGFSKTFGNNG